MIVFKPIRYGNFRTLLKLQRSSICLQNPAQKPHLSASSILSSSRSNSSFSSIFQKPFSLVSELLQNYKEKNQKKSDKTANVSSIIASFFEYFSEFSHQNRQFYQKKYEKRGNSELYSKKLDGRIRKKDNRSLFAVFCDRGTKEGVKLVKHVDPRLEDPLVQKEFFSAIEMFIQHLFKEGYLKKATFIPKNGVVDLSLFRNIHGRGYLKSAGYEFGKDKQEIAKWLSAGDLKKVALFGCPSLEKRTVHAANNTRRFFKIEEHKVCRKCRLKDSCELANKQRKKDLSKLHLGYVIRLLLAYAPLSEPGMLVVPGEIKKSVSQLLKEVVNLSPTIS